jgi:hypothetical protein
MPGTARKCHAQQSDAKRSQDMRAHLLEAGSALEHVARGRGVVEADPAGEP